MSATNQGPGVSPVPVVDVLELAEHLRTWYADPTYSDRSYTDIENYLVTDIGATIAAAVTASRAVLTSDVHVIAGWALAETTGAAKSQIRLHDGIATNTPLLASISIPSGGSAFMPPNVRGIRVTTGNVFLEVVSGSTEGVIYWR